MKYLPTIAFLAVSAIIQYNCATQEATRKPETGVLRPRVSGVQERFDSTYSIRKGDQVQLSVWGYPEFTTTAVVKEAGTITIPLIGEVIAAGLTKDQFTESLRKRLSEYIKGEIRVTVSIVTTVGQKVNVFGAVSRPQGYPVVEEASLLDVLIGAGGMGSDADLTSVKIWHAGENNEASEVDLSGYLERGNIDDIPKLYPGDTVFVPRKENFVREVTEFLRDIIYLFGFFGVFR